MTFPTLHTARLRLRPIRAADAPTLAALLANPAVARNMAMIPWPYTVEDAAAYIKLVSAQAGEESALIWAIEQNGFAGVVSLDEISPAGDTADLGYYLAPTHWGAGYAREAARAVIDHAFGARGMTHLTAGHADDNSASGRILEQLGFALTGRSERVYATRGGELTMRCERALPRSAWKAMTP